MQVRSCLSVDMMMLDKRTDKGFLLAAERLLCSV